MYMIWEVVDNEKFNEIKGIVDAINRTDFSLSTAILSNAIYEL